MLALDCAATEFFKDGITSIGEKKTRRAPEQAKYLSDLVVALSDRHDRGRHVRRRHGRLEGADRSARQQVPARRRRSVRHQCQAACDGIKNGRANSILIKVNQIGTLTETLDAVELAQNTATPPYVTPLRRNRRFHHRRFRGRHQLRADQTGSLAVPTARQYNQLLRIEQHSASRRNMRAGRRSNRWPNFSALQEAGRLVYRLTILPQRCAPRRAWRVRPAFGASSHRRSSIRRGGRHIPGPSIGTIRGSR